MVKLKNKKINDIMEEFKSVSKSSDKYKIRKAPAERLEEIARFTNKFDNFMSSQGYTRKIITSFNYDNDNDFWFQYEYSKEPLTKDMGIGIAYRLSNDHFWIFSYNTKYDKKFDIFKFLEKNYRVPEKEGLEELKTLREKEDKILSEKLPKLSNIDFKKFKKVMQNVKKEITKNRYKEKPKGIDLTELLKPYHNKDLHLAVTKDYSKVVGTGKTIEEAVKAAENAGYKDCIIMRSPDDTLGNRI